MKTMCRIRPTLHLPVREHHHRSTLLSDRSPQRDYPPSEPEHLSRVLSRHPSALRYKHLPLITQLATLLAATLACRPQSLLLVCPRRQVTRRRAPRRLHLVCLMPKRQPSILLPLPSARLRGQCPLHKLQLRKALHRAIHGETCLPIRLDPLHPSALSVRLQWYERIQT